MKTSNWIRISIVIVLLYVIHLFDAQPSLAKPTQSDEMQCPTENNQVVYHCWITWSSDGQWLAIADSSWEGIEIWNAETGKLARRLETPMQAFAWNSLPEQAMLLATVYSYPYSVQIWNVETGQEVQSHNFEDFMFDEVISGPVMYLPDYFLSLDWNPIANQIAMSSAPWIGIWDMQNDEVFTLSIPTSTKHEQLPFLPQSSPNGQYLALAGEDINIYNTDTLQLIKEIKTDNYAMNAYQGLQSIDWSPNSRFIMTEAIDLTTGHGVIRIFDIDSEELTVIESHTSPMNAVAWSPTGELIASAGGDDFMGVEDNAIRIWDAESHNLVQETLYNESIMSISWNPEGTQLAAVDASGAVYIIDIETTQNKSE